MVDAWEAPRLGDQVRLAREHAHDVPNEPNRNSVIERVPDLALSESTVAVLVAFEEHVHPDDVQPSKRLVMAILLADGSYDAAMQEEQGRDRISFGPVGDDSQIVDALVKLMGHNGVWGIAPDWRGANSGVRESAAPLRMGAQISFSTERGDEVFDWIASLWRVDESVREVGVVLGTDEFGNEYTLATDNLGLHHQTRQSLDESFRRHGQAPVVDANSYRWMIEGWPNLSTPNEESPPERTTEVEALLRAQGVYPRTFKGRSLPVGEDGAFVHYLDFLDQHDVLWEQGERTDPAAPETDPEELHEAVFKDAEGSGYYLVYSEGFVEVVPLGDRHDEATFVAMGEWLSENLNDE